MGPVLWSAVLAGSLGMHDINLPCERITQGDAATVDTQIQLSLARVPSLSLRFDSSLELMPNENWSGPHAPAWAAWGLAVRWENEFGSFFEVGHWSGHGVPGPALFRESQVSRATIGVRFGRPLASIPAQVR